MDRLHHVECLLCILTLTDIQSIIDHSPQMSGFKHKYYLIFVKLPMMFFRFELGGLTLTTSGF